MPKGTDTDIKTVCATALKKGEAFTVKELGVPYSTVKRLIEGGYATEKAIVAKAGRGRGHAAEPALQPRHGGGRFADDADDFGHGVIGSAFIGGRDVGFVFRRGRPGGCRNAARGSGE